MIKGGFNLRKWNSNDETVKKLTFNDNSKFIKDNEIRKVWAISWNILHDELELQICDHAKLELQFPATKQNDLEITVTF